MIRLEPDRFHCDCGKTLQVKKTERRTVTTMTIGRIVVHQTFKACSCCGKLYAPDHLSRLVPPYSHYGYDVIEYIGRALFLENKSEKQVWKKLQARNVRISESEVRHLGRRFIIHLALLHQVSNPEIRRYLNDNGGYLLHIDGTCEAGSPHLIAVMDSITETVLGCTKVPSEAAEYLIPFLEEIKQLYGVPIAALSDMSKAFANALAAVFPGIVHFICHFHFLRDLGKDLFNGEYTSLREEMRRFKIRGDLNSLKRNLRNIIKKSPFLKEPLEKRASSDASPSQEALPTEVNAYLLIHWIFDYDSELDGYGFPFDRSHLALYRRMREVLNTLEDSQRCEGYLETLRSHLSYFLEDQHVKSNVESMEMKIQYFDRLRSAMRIAQLDGKKGLNDEGDDDMGQIEAGVKAFIEDPELQRLAKFNDDFANMVKQIRKRWGQLFTDPIVVERDGEKHVIQPQRTNNILERLFRDSQSHHRRKTGKNSRAKSLQTMFADTLMVKNLENLDVYKILLNGKATLAERFSEISAELVRKKLESVEEQEDRLSPAVRKMLRETMQFPSLLMRLVG